MFCYFILYIYLYTYNFILHILHYLLNEQYINKLTLKIWLIFATFYPHYPTFQYWCFYNRLYQQVTNSWNLYRLKRNFTEWQRCYKWSRGEMKFLKNFIIKISEMGDILDFSVSKGGTRYPLGVVSGDIANRVRPSRKKRRITTNNTGLTAWVSVFFGKISLQILI